MQAFPARVRIAAPVAVPVVCDLPVDTDDRFVEIDVPPAQSQRLVLPESEREPDRPLGAVASDGSQPEQRAGLGAVDRAVRLTDPNMWPPVPRAMT